MAKKISAGTQQELVVAIGARYRAAGKADKLRILDEFVAITGYHRKHVIRLLNSADVPRKPRRARLRVYDEAVREALIVLWEASDRVCGKRLKPLLAVLVPALEHHQHLQLDDAVRAKVLSASAATIDRVLATTRAAVDGEKHARRRATPALRSKIPVRTFGDWGTPLPGFVEMDLVAHGGESGAGSFVHSLVMTDIATTWTECVPLVVRQGALIVEALERLRTSMPFPLRGIDTDNGGEFINEDVFAFCKAHNIVFTRSRPYRKNDQAWIEQKNGSVVRRLVGYRRLEGVVAAEGLGRLYAASRFFVNFFQPSFKLKEKVRVGSRVTKRYHPPETPCSRLMASAEISDDTKDRLRTVGAALDPLRLLDEIRAAQHYLAGLAGGVVQHTPARSDAELDGFLKSLATTWKDGEVRATHRPKAPPRRDWRTRKDPLEAVIGDLRAWFDEEPDRNSKELLERLKREHPGVVGDGQIRTLQRRLKDWRREVARRLVFARQDGVDVGFGANFEDQTGSIPN